MAPYRLSEISDQSLTINYQTWICQSSVGMETFFFLCQGQRNGDRKFHKSGCRCKKPSRQYRFLTLNQNCAGCKFQNKALKFVKILHRTERGTQLWCCWCWIVWGFVTMIDSFDVTQSIVISWSCDQFQCDMAQSKVGIPNFILSSASKIHQTGEQLYVAEWTQRNVSFSSFIVKVWVSLAAVSAEMIW